LKPILALFVELALAPLLIRLFVDDGEFRNDWVSIVHSEKADSVARRAMCPARQRTHEALVAAVAANSERVLQARDIASSACVTAPMPLGRRSCERHDGAPRDIR
jgi:hypothetical protein